MLLIVLFGFLCFLSAGFVAIYFLKIDIKGLSLERYMYVLNFCNKLMALGGFALVFDAISRGSFRGIMINTLIVVSNLYFLKARRALN